MDKATLAAIRERAEKATPGPWVTDDRHRGCVYCNDSTGSIISECPNKLVLRSPINDKENAAYIATVNPSTVLHMLDYIAKLEAVAEKGDNLLTVFSRTMSVYVKSEDLVRDRMDAVEELEQALAALEQEDKP